MFWRLKIIFIAARAIYIHRNELNGDEGGLFMLRSPRSSSSSSSVFSLARTLSSASHNPDVDSSPSRVSRGRRPSCLETCLSCTSSVWSGGVRSNPAAPPAPSPGSSAPAWPPSLSLCAPRSPNAGHIETVCWVLVSRPFPWRKSAQDVTPSRMVYFTTDCKTSQIYTTKLHL